MRPYPRGKLGGASDAVTSRIQSTSTQIKKEDKKEVPIRSSSKERHRYIEDQGGEVGKVDSKLVIALRKSGRRALRCTFFLGCWVLY